MLMADLRWDFVRTWFTAVDRLDFGEFERIYADLEAEGMRLLGRDIARKRIACARAADMRYVGQEHPVTVELPGSFFRRPDRAALKRLFDDEHMKRYTFNAPREPAEIVSLHSSVIGSLDKPVAARLRKRGAKGGRSRPRAPRAGGEAKSLSDRGARLRRYAGVRAKRSNRGTAHRRARAGRGIRFDDGALFRRPSRSKRVRRSRDNDCEELNTMATVTERTRSKAGRAAGRGGKASRKVRTGNGGNRDNGRRPALAGGRTRW
jgi:hypothetical protein